MNDKLKEAIATVRSGDQQTAKRQLTTLLEKNPEQAQGWYLLSLLVDSPQKQSAYLSKTLAINPNHSKAKEQLTTLQGSGAIAPTSTVRHDASHAMDVLSQAESETLPDWLQNEGEPVDTPEPVAETTDTAVLNETLPDWLKEPTALNIADDSIGTPVEEGPTVVGKTAQSDDDVDKAVTALRQEVKKQPQKKQAKPKPAASKSTSSLNIVLSLLVILAFIVMVILAYLIFI